MTSRRTRLEPLKIASFLLAAASIAGACAPPEVSNDVEAAKPQALYQTGASWPVGAVNVCWDPVNGDNPTLVALARKVLANSWERAAQISFLGWRACPLYPSGATSFVRVHFGPGTDGYTSHYGYVPPVLTQTWHPGIVEVNLISNDSDPFQEHFRYEVIHEFGHVLGFAHEQERPDNWDSAGNPKFCGSTDNGKKAISGGTYLTPTFDFNSIMDYCSSDPLLGAGHWRTVLSSGDIAGARKAYGRGPSHGFMILSDTNSGLAVNAFGGAREGTQLALHNACTSTNPDCTWSYQFGMLTSDTDPTLAVIATGGANEGVILTLTRSCTIFNPDCTWTYKNGEFLSDNKPWLALNASGGARLGAAIQLTGACQTTNTDCTWTMPHVMLSSARNSLLDVNAYGGAAPGTQLKLHDACSTDNPDCTFKFTKGMIISDRNTTLALTPLGGPNNLAGAVLAGGCTASNTNCTWSWTRGELIVDNQGSGILPINALGGAVFAASLGLNSACTPLNPDCVFAGYFAGN